MGPAETLFELAAFPGRRAGSDAERRCAERLCARLRAVGVPAEVTTFWCRPRWALAQALHALLALIGSLAIVSSPRIGGGLLIVTLVSTALDATTGRSLARRLTPERASQNVVAGPPPAAAARPSLIVTANYDAGPTGRVYGAPRALAARLRRAAADGRLTPGWIGWLAIAQLWLIAIAVLRNGGVGGRGLDIVQALASVALLFAAAALLELARAPTGPAAGDNGSGTAAAIAVAVALRRQPPRALDVTLVLQGAGDGEMAGLAHHLRAGHRRRRNHPLAVLGLAPCGAGSPRWWISDGPLWPLRFDRRLRMLASTLARPHRGRGASPALPARLLGIPAIALGCLDDRGRVPRSHRGDDRNATVDPSAIAATVAVALELIGALDATLIGGEAGGDPSEPAPEAAGPAGAQR